MTINPLYMIAPSLQQYFVDKTTGAPLAGGVVTFYQDESRTTLKNIYQISGSPNYTYTALPNPLTLSSIGTVVDNGGNQIPIYYYPFDVNGNVQLYYITVYNSAGVLQFTIQGWPNFSEGMEIVPDFMNLVPNPQFLVHNNIQATTINAAGEITAGITFIAPGGWTFERPSTSTATDFVTFLRYGSPVTNPTGNPRYAVRIQCTSPALGDSFKDLRIKYLDVNKFASATQNYTFSFSGQSNTGSNVNIELVMIRYFGSGGSATTNTVLTTFNVTTSTQIFNFSAILGNNVGKTIGASDDDYVQFAFRLPPTSVSDVTLTDFCIIQNEVIVTSFPDTPYSDFISQGVAGFLPVPDPNGNDLGLPIILDKTGFTFDTSNIGKIYMQSYPFAGFGELPCDGTAFVSTDYSSDGIPYLRLFNKYFNNGNSYNVPIYGTGKNYFTAIFSGSGNQLRIANNSNGAVTNTADGAVATGFTFATIHTGANYYCSAFLTSGATNTIQVVQNYTGAMALNHQPADGTAATGFTFSIIKFTEQEGTTSLYPYNTWTITTTDSTLLASKYFTFSTIDAGGTRHDYYLWYKVSGVGTDPAVAGRTGIEVDLTTDTAQVVAQKTMEALNGFQQTTILTTAGSAITAGSYFTVNSTANPYYVWYTVNGAGTDPAVANKIGIKVAVLSTDTNTQVATETQIAINSYQFAVPNLQDYFVRGYNTVDTFKDRLSIIPGVVPTIGTSQADDIYSHNHSLATAVPVNGGTGGTGLGPTFTQPTDNTGNVETRPLNRTVYFVVKY